MPRPGVPRPSIVRTAAPSRSANHCCSRIRARVQRRPPARAARRRDARGPGASPRARRRPAGAARRAARARPAAGNGARLDDRLLARGSPSSTCDRRRRTHRDAGVVPVLQPRRDHGRPAADRGAVHAGVVGEPRRLRVRATDARRGPAVGSPSAAGAPDDRSPSVPTHASDVEAGRLTRRRHRRAPRDVVRRRRRVTSRPSSSLRGQAVDQLDPRRRSVESPTEVVARRRSTSSTSDAESSLVARITWSVSAVLVPATAGGTRTARRVPRDLDRRSPPRRRRRGASPPRSSVPARG